MQYLEKLTEPEILSNAFMIYKMKDCRATSSCFSKSMHKVMKEVKNWKAFQAYMIFSMEDELIGFNYENI